MKGVITGWGAEMSRTSCIPFGALRRSAVSNWAFWAGLSLIAVISSLPADREILARGKVFSAVRVKLGGGLVNHILTDLDVQCLAKDLPEFIEVDVGALKVGENLHVSQLKLPKGVKAVLHGGDDPIVVGIVGKGGSSEEAAEGEAAAE